MKSKAILADNYPKVFSELPENAQYFNKVEKFPDNSQYDEIEEKINEIDLSLQASPRKRRKSRSRLSNHSFSSRSSISSRSSKNQNELTTSSLFHSISSLSTTNVLPTPIKITHIIKKKKKKNVKKRKENFQYNENLSLPKKVIETKNDEQKKSDIKKKTNKKKLLPFSCLYPGYIIRFNHHPKNVVSIKKSPGCPTIITYSNRDVETKFADGTSQILHCFQKFTYFSNGDVQQDFPDGAKAYFYASNKAAEFTHPNGTKAIQFCNGERYTYYPNVKIEITHHPINQFENTFDLNI